jgi:hypothetical protein
LGGLLSGWLGFGGLLIGLGLRLCISCNGRVWLRNWHLLGL